VYTTGVIYFTNALQIGDLESIRAISSTANTLELDDSSRSLKIATIRTEASQKFQQWNEDHIQAIKELRTLDVSFIDFFFVLRWSGVTILT
jgi:hypothetical protein